MTKKYAQPRLRLALLSVSGVAAGGLLAAGVVTAHSLRTDYSEADRARSTAAVARMDAAQARADQSRAAAQKTIYKGF